jgi:zinc transporter, ZIP family
VSPVWNIILVSLIAGLGTGIGGLVVLIRQPGKRTFGLFMGVTAGVMISLSFLELVNEAWQLAGYLAATIGFAAGAITMFALDFFIPHIRFGEREIHASAPDMTAPPGDRIPHRRYRFRQQRAQNHIVYRDLLQSGILLAIGIARHNLPEGLAIGAGFIHSPRFGVFIALAIMLHDIPEGIATALPLCKSGVCRWDSFRAATLSGLTEPVGALIAALFLSSFQSLVPAALAFAGGGWSSLPWTS